MIAHAIEQDFRAKVSSEIHLVPEGVDRYRVVTPFLFEDGDHLVIVMRREAGNWVLTDEGHTLMHLTYDIDEKDLLRGTRQKIIANALEAFGVEDRDGELRAVIHDHDFGDGLFSYVQGLLKIADVSYLNRERVRSTFLEDFRALLVETVPENRRIFDWHDPTHDPRAKYPVDCRINGLARPLMVFALQNDDKVRDAHIALLTYEEWGVPHRSVGIFRDQEEVNRKVLARFSDICDKQFSSLDANRERIQNYVAEALRQ
jgi:hypothetical protein